MASTSQNTSQEKQEKDNRLFTVNQVLDILENEDDFSSADIYVMPPENQEGDTDEDSADEDDAPAFDNFTPRQLKAGCSARVHTRSNEDHMIGIESDESDENDAPNDIEATQIQPEEQPRKRPKIIREWNKSDIQQVDDVFNSSNWIELKDYTPACLFELFFDDEVISHIMNMSVLYAQQAGNNNFVLPEADLKLTIAILIISGYSPLPRRRMYWEQSEDCFNSAIANSLTINRFEEILRYLHFADNFRLDRSDKMAKIRPLFSMLNERYLNFWVPEQKINVDESMAPYYGRHGSKQFIRGKPIRYGYKLWCLNTPTGYLIQMEPYQGKGTVKILPGLGMGGSVVFDLLSELPENNYSVFFDNLFTSLPLLDDLKTHGFHGTGTLRQNRDEKCPIRSVADMKKTERGAEDHTLDKDNNIIVIRWNDNSVVTVASTKYGVEPTKRASRYSQAAKQQVSVTIPNAIARYNESMGGTDRMDQNIANYRVSIRIKKWWWPLFNFSLMTSTHNAWQLYRKSAAAEIKPLPYLDFLRQIALTYVFKYRCNNRGYQIPGRMERALREDMRKDNEAMHFLKSMPTQRRCRLCKGNTKKACSICPSCPLHEKCFEAYHSSN